FQSHDAPQEVVALQRVYRLLPEPEVDLIEQPLADLERRGLRREPPIRDQRAGRRVALLDVAFRPLVTEHGRVPTDDPQLHAVPVRAVSDRSDAVEIDGPQRLAAG